MDAKTLRASILQMAIEGKLVPQLEEEPAVEQIGEAPEEVPFEIPEKWKWMRLSDITSKISDGTHHSPISNPTKTDNFPFLYITAKNIKTAGIDISSATFVSKEVHDEIYARCNPEYGDVLFIKDGATTGVVTQNTLRYPFSLLSSVALLKPRECIDSSYLVHAMSSPEFNKDIRNSMSGTGIPRVTLKVLKNILLPVPPVAEQHRIVARLNELLPLVDKFGKAQEALAVAQKEFPDKLKASLLQEAIQGKLVPQLDDEPSVEQIGEAPEDVPFAIPEKWKWIRLSDITSKISDGTHHSPVSNPIKTDSFPFLYITAKNIRTTGIETSSATFVSKKVHDEIYARCNPEYGDVLFIKDGATTGVVTQNTLRNPFSLLSSVALLKPSEHIDSSYLVHAMSSPEFNKAIRSSMAGTGIPRVTLKILKNILLPVPPISEQRRIVARLNELLPLVDRMVAQATADK